MDANKKDKAYEMMLELLESYNSSTELSDWAEKYGHTLSGKRYFDQFKNAAYACVSFAAAAKE